jgi:hypothetical protein
MAKLEGYQYLADVQVDGVNQVWEDFLQNRVLAYGNAKAVVRQGLEQELETLLSFAQRSCQSLGGTPRYVQEKLAVFDAKYGSGSNTDDYTTDMGLFGNSEGESDSTKQDRYFSRLVCEFEVTYKGGQSGSDVIQMGSSAVCDAGDASKKATGRIIGSVLGAGLGATAGIITADKANIMTGKGGQAVLGTGGGLAVGLAGLGIGSILDNRQQRKADDKLKCVVAGQKEYNNGDTMTVAMSSAFTDLENFYAEHPELLVERAEYLNTGYRGFNVQKGDATTQQESIFQ